MSVCLGSFVSVSFWTVDPLRIEERLAEYLRSSAVVVEVSSFVQLAGGWEADIYAFDVSPALSNGLDRLVLRMYSGAEGGRKACREFSGIGLLAGCGYPVPQVVSFDSEGAALGRPFLIMQRIEGTLLGEAMIDDDDRLQEAPTLDFVRLMVDLHELNWRPFAEPLTGETNPKSVRRARRLLEGWRSDLRDLPGFSAPVDWLLAGLDQISPESPAVIHGDFHPWNVLVDQSGRLKVIDWTGITVLDRRYDLAWSLLLAGSYLGDEVRQRLENLYRSLATQRVSDLGYFDALAATMRLHHMVVSLTSSPEQVGMRAGAADAMREQVAAYRWVADLLADRTGLVIPEVEALLVGGG
ncbi:MAG: phosphotransferase [Acidimicrobiia bacterium]|nr:phosphotransferase [Acidimicrobiia bacterium]